MKKSCNNCKAYEFHHECSLGYKNQRGEPKEDCPKPLTTKALVSIYLQRKQKSENKTKENDTPNN